MNKKVLFTSQAALIAALYVVLTIFISAFGLANGAIQIRISEALTVLPFLPRQPFPVLPLAAFSVTSSQAVHLWTSSLVLVPHFLAHWGLMPCADINGWFRFRQSLPTPLLSHMYSALPMVCQMPYHISWLPLVSEK